jgi:hypothetical protein
MTNEKRATDMLSNTRKYIMKDKQKKWTRKCTFETQRRIKELGNSNIILQYKNTTMHIAPERLLQLAPSDEVTPLLEAFRHQKQDEYVVVAYSEGHVVGCRINI